MKSGPSFRMARALALSAAALALGCVGLCRSAAGPLKPQVYLPQAPTARYDKPLSRYRLQDLPRGRVSQEAAAAWQGQLARAAAGIAPPPTPRQNVDLTTTARATGGANFRIDDVPAGDYTIRARKGGWQTASQSLVSAQVNVTGISLQQRPDHTFPSGVQLIALPADFPGVDAASLFDKSPSKFDSAYFVTKSNGYAIYPDLPAREFRLGKAMFVKFTRPTPFTKAGIEPKDGPFYKTLDPGWNMVGNVRRSSIEWLSVAVLTPDGRERTMQQAMDDGIIQNGLWGYEDGYYRSDFMDPFNGYFVRALQRCTLKIPVAISVGAAPGRGRERTARVAAPSVHQVAAELSAAGLNPAVGPASWNAMNAITDRRHRRLSAPYLPSPQSPTPQSAVRRRANG